MPPEDNRWAQPLKIPPLELDPNDTGRLNINAQFDLRGSPNPHQSAGPYSFPNAEGNG